MIDFYEKNHEKYFHSTVEINPGSFLTPLTRFLHSGASILDIGCGSGRDLLWLRQHGFSPTGFERSPGLARLANQHSSCPVIEGDFQNYDFSSLSFDALICIGSLVHLSRGSLKSTITTVSQALKENGYILLTFKEGQGTSQFSDDRIFTLWSREDLENIFSPCGMVTVDFTRVVSKLRAEDTWLGFVIRKVHG